MWSQATEKFSNGELLGGGYTPCKFPGDQELMDGGYLETSMERIG